MHDKTVLITGGASGIGRAIGELCASRGARVVLADRQLDLAREVAAGIERRGGKARAVELDVRDRAAFGDVAKDVRAREGTIDWFFNNAGIGVGGRVEDYDDRAWSDVLEVNLGGVIHGVQAVYPIMRAQRAGHIVNTASMAGFLPMPGGASYTTSKHAVVGLTKALRVEAAAHGVRASVLCPGAIQTPILTGGAYGRNVGRRLPKEKMQELWDRFRPMNVDAFAVEVLKDVEANEPYIIVPRWWKAMWLLERLAPKLSLAFGARSFAEQRAAFDAHGLPAEEEEPAAKERSTLAS